MDSFHQCACTTPSFVTSKCNSIENFVTPVSCCVLDRQPKMWSAENSGCLILHEKNNRTKEHGRAKVKHVEHMVLTTHKQRLLQHLSHSPSKSRELKNVTQNSVKKYCDDLTLMTIMLMCCGFAAHRYCRTSMFWEKIPDKKRCV